MKIYKISILQPKFSKEYIEISLLLNQKSPSKTLDKCFLTYTHFRTSTDDSFWTLPRSSHQRFSVKKGVLRNFAKFTGKHLCRSLFFNKVAGLRPVTYFWSVFSCIGTEYRKIQIRKNSTFGHFSRSESVKKSSGTDVFLGILRQFQEHPFL